MTRIKLHYLTTSLLILILLAHKAVSQTNTENGIRINFSNIRKEKGTLRLGLFRTEEDFKKEKPFKSIIIPKKGIKNNCLTAIISLPEGSYGISVLDDENDNLKMDYNLVGVPKEGFGFANYYHNGFSKPKLSEFLIKINKDITNINCKLRYI